MNVNTKTVISEGEVVKGMRSFHIPLQFSSHDIALIEPLWSTTFEQECETATMGTVRFTLSDGLVAEPTILFLTIQIGKHRYTAHFPTDSWIGPVSEAFEEGFMFADFPDAAALALEVQFATTLAALEELFGQDISFLRLSAENPNAAPNTLPGANFTMHQDGEEAIDISIKPQTIEANEALIAMLTKNTVKPSVTETAHQAVTLSGSLVADVTEMSREQLGKLQPGDGFMLNANWFEKASYNFTVADKVIATMVKGDDAFTIDKLFISAAPLTTNQNAMPQERRARRKRNRGTKSND